MTYILPTRMPASDLRVGDVVTPAWGERTSPFDGCIVRQVTGDGVTLYRPYGHCQDFSYTGGVICYTGLEEYTVSRHNTESVWLVWCRMEPGGGM